MRGVRELPRLLRLRQSSVLLRSRTSSIGLAGMSLRSTHRDGIQTRSRGSERRKVKIFPNSPENTNKGVDGGIKRAEGNQNKRPAQRAIERECVNPKLQATAEASYANFTCRAVLASKFVVRRVMSIARTRGSKKKGMSVHAGAPSRSVLLKSALEGGQTIRTRGKEHDQVLGCQRLAIF